MQIRHKVHQHRDYSTAGMVLFVFLIVSFLPAHLLSQPLANGKTKFLGNILGFSGFPANFVSYWNQITPENNGKWDQVEAVKDAYTWTRLDAIYNYALDRSLPFKMHNLVWGQQQPTWLASLDTASQVKQVEEWVKLVGQRYPRMSFIDVVNEPLHLFPPPPYLNALGGAGSTGWDWVIRVFEFARKYCDPAVKLILNDYGIINDASATSKFLVIINLLKNRNLIDGIGVQGHRFELETATANTLKINLDALAATGLPIYISEFDVAPGNVLDDAQQLAEYQRVFPVLWQHPGVKGITLWGYTQNQTWQTNAFLVTTSGSERPALQWLRTYLATTGVAGPGEGVPHQFRLDQNYPNPFNPSTKIHYSLPEESRVRVDVYNLLGVRVRTLVDAFQNGGDHLVTWDAMDNRGNPVTSGVYVCRLATGNQYMQRKMVLLH